MKKLLILIAVLATLTASAGMPRLHQSAVISIEGGFLGNGRLYKPATSRASIGVHLNYGIGVYGFRLVPNIGIGYSKTNLEIQPGQVGRAEPPIHYRSLRWGIDLEYNPWKCIYVFTGVAFWYGNSVEVVHTPWGVPDYVTFNYDSNDSYWRFGAGVKLRRFHAKIGYSHQLNWYTYQKNYPLFVTVGYSFWQK